MDIPRLRQGQGQAVNLPAHPELNHKTVEGISLIIHRALIQKTLTPIRQSQHQQASLADRQELAWMDRAAPHPGKAGITKTTPTQGLLCTRKPPLDRRLMKTISIQVRKGVGKWERRLPLVAPSRKV
jgi:virulence-associated protein VagC